MSNNQRTNDSVSKTAAIRRRVEVFDCLQSASYESTDVFSMIDETEVI